MFVEALIHVVIQLPSWGDRTRSTCMVILRIISQENCIVWIAVISSWSLVHPHEISRELQNVRWESDFLEHYEPYLWEFDSMISDLQDLRLIFWKHFLRGHSYAFSKNTTSPSIWLTICLDWMADAKRYFFLLSKMGHEVIWAMKRPSYFPSYWLFNRHPGYLFHGLWHSPNHNWVGFHPLFYKCFFSLLIWCLMRVGIQVLAGGRTLCWAPLYLVVLKRMEVLESNKVGKKTFGSCFFTQVPIGFMGLVYIPPNWP